MSKAPKDHIDKLRNWLQFNDELCKIDPENEYEWEGLKNDYEEDEDFFTIMKSCEDKDGFSWGSYMRYYHSNISHIHMRIIFGFEVLIDNCCDPELDYLEFNNDIKKSLELLENTNDKK
jgi:hypothetical protein